MMRASSLPLWRGIAGIGIVMLMSGCAGSELSLTEYVDRLNAINDRTVPEAAVLISALEEATTPTEMQATMEQMAALRIESIGATEVLEPPAQVADLHSLFLEWERQLYPIEEAFAARAGTAAGWEELFESDEVAAYRAALTEGKRVCDDFQATIDATADRGVFEDTPWIPSTLTEVVEARLGCDLFPDDPENVFRLP